MMNFSFNALFFFSIINTCPAQVPVGKEPRHHNVLENRYVRLLDVHIPPGDTTFFHKHETPSVFIVLSNAKTGSEVISEGATTNAPATYGNIWFDGFYTKPRIHRVWNNDSIEFHVMDIELLSKEYQSIDSFEQQKSLKMLFDEKPVRAYLCTLAPNSKLDVDNKKGPFLVIGLSDATAVAVNTKLIKQKGDFIFINRGGNNLFINKGNNKVDLAILELK